MRKQSKTDWARLDAMEEADIDLRDIPELDDDFFKRAELRGATKQAIENEEPMEVGIDE